MCFRPEISLIISEICYNKVHYIEGLLPLSPLLQKKYIPKSSEKLFFEAVKRIKLYQLLLVWLKEISSILMFKNHY